MATILLTNDDGISSPGLAALRRVLDPLAEVTTIAPDGNRSAIARGITVGRPLHARRVEFGDGFSAHALDGTPVDCVRAAMLEHLCPRPGLVVAGVNLGPNMGEDVTYSGTVGAALEAALLGVPGVAVSIRSRLPEHLDDVTALVAPLVVEVLRTGLPQRIALNVNLPDCPASEVEGVEITSLGSASYQESLVVESDDGRDRRYRVDSQLRDCENEDGTDFAAVARGRISVTPLTTDWADAEAAGDLVAWDLEALVLGGRGGDA